MSYIKYYELTVIKFRATISHGYNAKPTRTPPIASSPVTLRVLCALCVKKNPHNVRDPAALLLLSLHRYLVTSLLHPCGRTSFLILPSIH